jgi:hypothetical protein
MEIRGGRRQRAAGAGGLSGGRSLELESVMRTVPATDTALCLNGARFEVTFTS